MTDSAISPPSIRDTVSVPRAVAGAVLLAALLFWAWTLYDVDAAQRALSFSLLAGAAFGIVLQRGRFCFLCNFRDFLERRDPRGLLSIVVALAVGFVLYQVVFLAWMPVPQPDRLPPTAHVGPVSPILALSSFVFGVGMAISGSCLSAHFYRLGEGSPTSPFALVGAALGFVLGFVTWNPLFLSVISYWPVTWLPHQLGYAGTMVVTLAALAVIALLLLRFARPQQVEPATSPSLRGTLCAVFVKRWSWALTGAAVGVISMAAYFRVAPLGVTAELGSLARTAASTANLLPDTLYGLDALRGCATVVKQALFSNNGMFVIGIVVASFASALVAGQFRPAVPTGGQVVRGLIGGVLMGWGAMVGLGCTVGVLLSGIHAGALAGWVFLVFCTLGVWLGLLGMRRFSR